MDHGPCKSSGKEVDVSAWLALGLSLNPGKHTNILLALHHVEHLEESVGERAVDGTFTRMR